MFEKPGKYTVTLLVTDVTGASDKVVKVLNVISRAPIANFSHSIPKKNHPNRVEFNAINSYDPDEGDTITYSWDFDGDGSFDETDKKEALITHEYDVVGEYRAILQVKDAFGKHDQVEKKISVKSVLGGDIIAKKRAVQVGEEIEFEADSKNAVAYLWEFGDGETDSTEDTKTTHTYNKTGKFNVKMSFFDKDDNDNQAKMTILAGSADQPVAAVNYRVNVREPIEVEDLCDGNSGAVVTRTDQISFDASQSINTDGSSRLLNYSWKFPGGETSSNKESRYKFDEINREGECFEASLVVSDQLSGKLSQEDKVYFKVVNKLPIITDFVITPPTSDELVTPAKIKLRVVNPKDIDGTIKKYKWWYYRDGFSDEKFGTHNTSTDSTDITITSFGESDVTNRYFFVVEVTDNDNGSYTSEERFGEVSYLDVKNGPNLSPVAEFTLDKTTISTGDSITFVSKSYDPQGETLPNDAYRWDFDGDGEFDDTTTGPQINRQYNTPGEYDVRLKVVHRGLSSSANKTVYVEATDSLPQAGFTYTVDENTVSFDGNTSRFDPSLPDTTLRFGWDFDTATDDNGNGVKDDDVQSTEIKPTHTYTQKGTYKVRLSVKDMLGMEGVVVRDINLTLTEAERQKSAYKSLKVSAPTDPLTTLDIEVIPATLSKGGTADVNATVLNADGSEYTGKVFFEVMDGSGNFTPNPAVASSSKANSIFTATDEGKTKIRIRATGTNYGELTETATINVK
jgi:PKD repeat protein